MAHRRLSLVGDLVSQQMRWVRALSLALVCVALWNTAVDASAAQRIRVVRCPTVFGVTGERMHAPNSIVVAASKETAAGLSAYTNGVDFLVAPSGMVCSGIVAA